MRAIDRKLLRDLWHLKGQMISIALVVATGIMTVMTMRGSYESLEQARDSYYRQARFADVWAPLRRAPLAVARKLAEVPGVATVDTRISLSATLDLPGLDAPAQGHFVSLPDFGQPLLNDINLVGGRMLVPANHDEVLISENFATARKLHPGDTLRAVINGRARTLDIVGIANGPEHSYAVPPGSLFPDDERYGIVWMGRSALAAARDMDGAFNEAILQLYKGASVRAVLRDVDRLLEPYGGLGAYARKDQISHLILEGELDQNRVMGTAIPTVFLAVAAFLLNLVLGRLIATQRSEIAVLKAFGYRDREVGLHFLMFAVVAVFIGTVTGVALGTWLGHAYIGIYAQFFDFPDLRYRVSPPLVMIAIAVSMLAAAAGALSAARRAASLPPAEAMRAEPPASFEAGWLERLGLASQLPASLRMILRNLGRKPAQTLMSSLGVAFSVAILVIGMFMFDGVRVLMDLQFRVIQREDVMVIFNQSLAASVRHELAHLPGVTRVETFRQSPVRLSAGAVSRTVGIQGMHPDGKLRRIISANGREHPLPPNGIVLSAHLAGKLRVINGDNLAIEFLDGRRNETTAQVVGTVEDFLGSGAYMEQATLQRLAGGERMASGAWLAVEPATRRTLERYLKRLPAVAGVASPATTLDNFEKQLSENLYISIAFLLGFAAVIAIGVIYNGARISLSERGRELASLRVMGFRRSEVTVLLLGEQAVVTALAIPIGWLIGYALSLAVSTALQTDTYRIPFVISAQTYAIAAAVAIMAALASALIVRRRINNLDLIAVLKTRE